MLSGSVLLAALVWSASQLVLLLAAGWWAYARGRTFHAALCLICLVGSLVAAWSVTQVRGPLVDHLVFWISILGVVNTVAIVGVATSWIGDRVRRQRIHIPPLVERMIYVGFVSLVAVRGMAILVEDHRLAVQGQARFASERESATVLSEATQEYLRSHGKERPFIEIAQPVWSVTAGTVLRLLKAGTPVSVEERWLHMYGHVLRPTGDEDVDLHFADATQHERLRERPDYRLLADRSGTFLYARER